MTDDEKSGNRTINGSAASEGAGSNPERMMADDIVSEGLASLTVLCEQFATDVQLRQAKIGADTVYQSHSDLARIRNLLIVLDKSALAFVVKELMAICNPDRRLDAAAADQATKVLTNAAPQLCNSARVLHVNRNFDSALGLIAVINDCRACLDEPFLSDTFLLAIGIDLIEPAHAGHKTSEQTDCWLREQQIWTEVASSEHTRLSHCLQAWHNEINDETSDALKSQLERLASAVDQYENLQALSHLLCSAAETIDAIREEQFSNGPATSLIFHQLAQHVAEYDAVQTREDLVPRDLLRNFLYYVAQAQSDSGAALRLRRHFRLDRIRNLSSLAEPVKTPTIGVVYHLVNAIRSRITVQTQPLSEWLDSYQNKEQELPPLATIRVRLNQLEPILTLLGATEALQNLEALNVYLLSRTLAADINETMASRLAQLLVKIDTSLDQKGRQSIAAGKQSDPEVIRTDAVYIDMAIDVCLREARSELHTLAANILSQINSGEFDSASAIQANEQLESISTSLQILPLPGFAALVHKLTVSLATLATVNCSVVANADAQQGGDVVSISSVIDLLAGVFSSTDDFLSSVLWPELDVREFLSAAEVYLEKLRLVTGGDSHSGQDPKRAAICEAIDDKLQHSTELPQRKLMPDDFNVSEVGSLTLSFDEDLLQLPETQDLNLKPSISQEILFFSQSADLLDNLEQAVAHALTPSANQRMQLPSLVMLKSLYSLTELAQSVGALEVLAIAQPLQRAALALHREGHQFDASQTRFIGKLVHAMRVRIQVFNSDRIVDTATTSVEKELPGFVGAIKKKTHAIKEKPEALLALGAEKLTLDEVFDKEAVEIVERINELLSNPVFNQEVLNEILACVHTLKGSARMAGRTAIHESAHLLESGVQAGRRIDDKKQALAQGCKLLQGFLSQPSSSADKQLDTDRLMSDMLDSAKHPPLAHSQGDDPLGQAKALSDAQRQLASALSKLDVPAYDVKCATQRMRDVIERGVVVSTSSLIPIVADLQLSNNELRKLLDQSRSAHRQVVQTAARMQQSVLRDSFISVDQMHERLTPIVIDAADKCGVAVQFIFNSSDLFISESVFRKLTTIIEHLVRNAIVHGIELPDERLSAHKPEKGSITLSIEFNRADLAIRLADDGRGVSVNAINHLLHKRGETPVNDISELHKLLFRPGFSSIEHATSIAGHGLGLAAVSNLVAQLDGEVDFEVSELPGMTIVITIPRRIVARRTVLVQNDNQLYGLPAANVISVSNRKAAPDAAADKSEALANMPRNVLFKDLLGVSEYAQGLNQSSDFSDEQYAASSATVIKSVVDPEPTVILDADGTMITTVVDRVIGYRMLIIDPIDEPMAASGRFSAIGLLETGERVLVVDVAKTLSNLETGSESCTELSASSATNRDLSRAVLSVMLIDDSPVNRTKLADMMSARGLAVRFPGNAMRAVECINQQKPDLIVLDLDIPAFNAGSFLRLLRQKYGDGAPPIIATSRHPAATARRVASKLGAAAFISKPCSDLQLYKALELAGMSVADLNIG